LVRQTYAHEALLDIGEGADSRAPGAAITLYLCGSWEHDGPCPLAPHHTNAKRDGAHLRIRVLFAVEPELEIIVRGRVEEALSAGHLNSPEGESTGWRLVHSGASRPTAGETERATRLASSP